VPALPRMSKASLKPARPAGARTGSKAGDDATTPTATPTREDRCLLSLTSRCCSAGLAGSVVGHGRSKSQWAGPWGRPKVDHQGGPHGGQQPGWDPWSRGGVRAAWERACAQRRCSEEQDLTAPLNPRRVRRLWGCPARGSSRDQDWWAGRVFAPPSAAEAGRPGGSDRGVHGSRRWGPHDASRELAAIACRAGWRACRSARRGHPPPCTPRRTSPTPRSSRAAAVTPAPTTGGADDASAMPDASRAPLRRRSIAGEPG